MNINRILLAKRLLYALCFLIVTALAQPVLAVPTYDVESVGLTDIEHTRNDGFNQSSAFELNEEGHVLGVSNRYNGGSTDLGKSVWLFDGTTTLDIGLIGAEHTRNDGYKNNEATQLNEAGQVKGSSRRFNSGSTDIGYSAWLYNGTTTINIGFTDNEHTRNDGYRLSGTRLLNDAGQVLGFSDRYNGNINLGRSAWLYNGAVTTNIGLINSEHTRNDGYRLSEADELNQIGRVAGHSKRYSSVSTFVGQSAWYYDGMTTIEIGLVDNEHKHANGDRFSEVAQLNNAGQIIGNSQRFGSTAMGFSAWLFDDGTTTKIGLTGGEHTRSSGYKYSEVRQLNESGKVIGRSDRYNGGNAQLGESAWLYDGAVTFDIGLIGSDYTRFDGLRSSVAYEINETGQVRGESQLFKDGIGSGQSAWLYNGATTIDVGLTGTEHTRNDGYKYSTVWSLNEAGHAAGRSFRYNGGSEYLGQSAWLYNGATTIDVGLEGTEHTRSDGYKYSETHELNELGRVTGVSYRYNGGNSELGQDAWLYDPVLDQTFAFRLSTRSDGYAYSIAVGSDTDGLTLGLYKSFDAFDNDLGMRAFSFRNSNKTSIGAI